MRPCVGSPSKLLLQAWPYALGLLREPDRINHDMKNGLRPLLVLHNDPVLRERVRKIARGAYVVDWLENWQNLAESMCKSRPHTLVLVDPYHGRGWQPGSAPGIAPELHGFLRDFPSATVIAALELRPGCFQDVLTLGEKGVTGVINLAEEKTTEAIERRLSDARGRRLRALLQEGVPVPLSGRGRAVLDAAVEIASVGKGVRDLAAALGLSKPTLLRWCADARLPTPRRLLIWMRALSAAELLDDPGRSVLHVAWSCGYSSDRALRRALRSTIGIAPSQLRRGGAFEVVAGAFTSLLARTAALPRAPPREPPDSRPLAEKRSFPRPRAPEEGPSPYAPDGLRAFPLPLRLRGLVLLPLGPAPLLRRDRPLRGRRPLLVRRQRALPLLALVSVHVRHSVQTFRPPAGPAPPPPPGTPG